MRKVLHEEKNCRKVNYAASQRQDSLRSKHFTSEQNILKQKYWEGNFAAKGMN